MKFGGGGFKTSKIDAPKFGSKSNPLELLIARELMQKQQQGQVGQDVQNINNQFGGQAPPGTKLSDTGYSIPVNRELSKDEIQTLNNFDAVKNHITTLKQFMKDDPSFKTDFARANIPFGEIGNKNAQLMKFSLGDMSDRLLRLRSGAQINNQEYNRLRSLMPTIVNITSGDYDVINKKLDTFNNEFDLARQRVLGGSQFETNRNISPIPGMNNPQPQANNGNIELERQQALQKIQSGKYDAKKVADLFRSRTGQELNGQ